MSGDLIEINKPSVSTWFIAYEDAEAFYHNGCTKTDQLTSTRLDNMETFTVEDDYVARAGVLDIALPEDE